MDKRTPNLILIGFSTTGKSQVGQEVARRLGWTLVDTDEEIVRRAGKPIPEIFAQNGETYFREMERLVLESACQQEAQVIATGGGVVVDAGNRQRLREGGGVICLEAQPETIYRRLTADASVRPLLATENPLERIESLKKARQPYYAFADWTVQTDQLSLEEVVEEVLRGFHYGLRRFDGVVPLRRTAGGQEVNFPVITSSQTYPVFVGWGLLDQLGPRLRRRGLEGAVFLVADETAFAHHGKGAVASLEAARLPVQQFRVPPGEESKSLATAGRLYDWLVKHRAERGHTVVTLGGGMVCDLAGFVASTFLRGLALVHVPTTLLAMVDAAIGGKVAVNHPEGKNLIGAFYQPSLVLMDPSVLLTLPPRELDSGWAEVLKHGFILDADFVDWLEDKAEELQKGEANPLTEAIVRSAAIKASVVMEDERETGKRTLLNYGHTIGHAVEAATGYRRFLHGEAVAIGMMGAGLIAQHLGMLSPQGLARQHSLLQRFGLPLSCSDLDASSLIRAMELDKKVREKAVRWVLLKGLGQATLRSDVPTALVREVVQELSR